MVKKPNLPCTTRFGGPSQDYRDLSPRVDSRGEHNADAEKMDLGRRSLSANLSKPSSGRETAE